MAQSNKGMSHKTRKRLSLLILVVALPAYIVAAVSLMALVEARFGRLPFLAELVIYIGLGVIWAFPLKSLFRGVGQPDPDDNK